MKNEIPNIGFGTWRLPNSSYTTTIIQEAIDCGYKLIDTASSYQNEEAIGDAIMARERSKLWLSGKLWNTDRNNVEQACDITLKKLRCDYLDLYLVHWPVVRAVSEDWIEINRNVWLQMERLVLLGKVRYIGLSNFQKEQLESLIPTCKIKPLVNQIEYHPGFTQTETVNYCQSNNVIVQAWSPLCSGKALKKEPIISLAQKYNRSPAQIILKWCTQNKIIPIVKSSDSERMKSNLTLEFTLLPEDMDYLNRLPYMGSSGLNSETITLFE